MEPVAIWLGNLLAELDRNESMVVDFGPSQIAQNGFN